MASEGSMSDDSRKMSGMEDTRHLPPPAFPQGHRRTEAASDTLPERGIPDDAFISPDEPIRREGRGIPDDAFISPDEPIVPVRRDEDGYVEPMVEIREPTFGLSDSGRRGTPTIHELPYLLDQLAEQLQEKGARALEVHSELGHFQAALRSFLKGYLEGGRG